MATAANSRLGPADHGTELTLDEYEAAAYEPGSKYELIDGRLCVSPEAELPHEILEDWLFLALRLYAKQPDAAIRFVARKGRVVVPEAVRPSVPEPDIAAYREDLPRVPPADRRWQNFSPLLVGEVVSAETAEKDLVRNVDLYLRVPSIREYWVLDGREDPDRPSLMVHRRRGARWQKMITVRFGETYTTRLLPGFELVSDPLG